MTNPVVDYYNLNPELEWNRLFVTPYRRIEYEVVRHFLDRYLPPQGTILDAGGGPGRYAIALAKLGYRVSLLDISEANIRFAKNKIRGAGVAGQFDACAVGDACNLRAFPNETFDAVLCMGPLYHLPVKNDRLACLRECRRVMKPGAPLFVTVLPRLTYLRDALRAGTFADFVPNELHVFEEIVERGYSPDSQVPQIFYCLPSDVKIELDRAGFDLVELASCHGLASFMDDSVNEMGKNPEAWNALIRWVLSTCSDPHSLAMAEHLVGVGTKRG